MDSLAFAQDHNDFLPGTFVTRDEAELWKCDWLSGQGVEDREIAWSQAPQEGTLFKYVGNAMEIYRCPSLTTIARNAGRDSNGKFDYAALESFAGAKVDRIELLSRFKNLDGTYQGNLATPLVVQEDAAYCINNYLNDGGHGTDDQITRIHSGGGPYSSLDGSIHFFKEPEGTKILNWESTAPGGDWHTIGFSPSQWGQWNGL